jgi:ferredoxin
MEDQEFQIGNLKVKVLRQNCYGASSCVAIAPDTFSLDEEMKAVVNPNSKDTAENILLAAQSCPALAIVITDAQTGEQVWPK